MKKSEIINGILHLEKNDPNISRIIGRSSQFNLKPRNDYFDSLLRAIIGQQLSLKAAASIIKKVETHFQGLPSAECILQTDDAVLRALGLSNGKVKYVKDLASKTLSRELSFRAIGSKSDEEIIKNLTKVKGIGVWTAHMFLIFTMCRPDVLPTGDLGIKKAVMLNYGLSSLPDEEGVRKIAAINNWQPYCTIASWYLWRSLEFTYI